MQFVTLPYCDPLEVASGIDEECWALLYSGMEGSGGGNISILGLYPEQEITADNFDALENVLTSDKGKYENFWVGYLSYGLKNTLEKLPQDEPSFINLPLLRFVKFGVVAVFDKKAKEIKVYGESKRFCDEYLNRAGSRQRSCGGGESLPFHSNESVQVRLVQSNMTDHDYLSNVEKFRQHILDGDIFQANLTRKFYGEIECENPFAVFSNLCSVSPAPYSAYMRFKDSHIISSSPEKFLTVSTEGVAESLPIKGTAPRGKTAEADEAIKAWLMDSSKNKAENLMIVDLMRSDFSKGCEHGSVEAANLFRVDTYETLHHMSSRISGQKRKDVSTLQFVKNCFPPGSMTGAPKIRAMEICSHTEKMARGVYSGALGWFGGDGSADLSVVIRTLIINRNHFEFQVGGAITSDSTPEDELKESMTKAKGILTALSLQNLTGAKL